MQRLLTEGTAELVVKHSRFLGFALPCADEKAFRAHLKSFQSRYADCRHICYAARYFGEGGQVLTRVFDAGEPSGSAGKPILNPINGADLVETLVIVLRYFGGVKLGVGGLVKAYGTCAKRALEDARSVPWVPSVTVVLTTSYAHAEPLQRMCSDSGFAVSDCTYGAVVTLTLSGPLQAQAELERSIRHLCHSWSSSRSDH